MLLAGWVGETWKGQSRKKQKAWKEEYRFSTNKQEAWKSEQTVTWWS